jgi:hypothetical protein
MIPSLTSRPFEAVLYLGPKWAKENGRAVVVASGQVEGVLRMNNQTSFMMEDLVCVFVILYLRARKEGFIEGFAKTRHKL